MPKGKAGRPRCGKSQEAIILATYALLDEKGGGGLTVEAVAKRAGVGKPTIYRWWPTLADLVLEALLSRADADIPVPPFESLHQSLREFLRRSMQAITEGAGVHLRFLMAQAQKDDAFRERFREQFVFERRAVLKSLFQQAAEHGDISPAHNPELIADIIFGAMWYRLLTGHAPLDTPFADDLAEAAMKLI